MTAPLVTRLHACAAQLDAIATDLAFTADEQSRITQTQQLLQHVARRTVEVREQALQDIATRHRQYAIVADALDAQLARVLSVVAHNPCITTGDIAGRLEIDAPCGHLHLGQLAHDGLVRRSSLGWSATNTGLHVAWAAGRARAA